MDPIPFSTIAAITVRLHGLAMQFPSALTSEIFTAIERGQKRMSRSFSTPQTFPTVQELILFYIIGQIYPTSDFSHVIINPTTLFMGQILGQMRVQNVQDLGRGLFVCSLFLQVQLTWS